jgi:hypothetical protein
MCVSSVSNTSSLPNLLRNETCMGIKELVSDRSIDRELNSVRLRERERERERERVSNIRILIIPINLLQQMTVL